MAFHDRNYMRDDWSPGYGSRRIGGGFGEWEVWKKLIAINVVAFLLQIMITRPATMDDIHRLPFIDPDLYAIYDDEDYVESQEEIDQQGSVTNEEESSDAETDADETSDDVASEKKLDKSESSDRNEIVHGPMEMSREQVREFMIRSMPRVSILQEYWELDSEKVKQGQVWRLITAGFCHDRMGIWHLLFNMLFLYWFGKRLERVFGSSEFTAFYFASLLTSSLAYIALDLYTNTKIPAIGASGAVWGVVALYALMYPYERIFIYFLFPVEIRWLVLLYFICDLHPVLLALSGENQFTGVAHAAHIGGAIFGFAYWNQGWRLMPVINRLKSGMPSVQKTSRQEGDFPSVVKMPTARNETKSNSQPSDRMDQILDKINQSGRESLSDDELEYLEEMSRKIRDERRDRS